MEYPNIFRFATSELSQDAFLCWILDWLNVKNHSMRKIGEAFLEIVFKESAIDINLGQLERVHIRQQFEKADIVAVLEFSSSAEKLCLIIEDKRDAHLSGEDQLQRNIKRVLASKQNWGAIEDVKPDRVIGIFVKTGYDYDFDVPPGYLKCNYRTFQEWIEWIRKNHENSAHDILEDWICFYQKETDEINRCLDVDGELQKMYCSASEADAIENRKYDGKWSNPTFQYALFKRLFFSDRNYQISAKEEGPFRIVSFRMDNNPEDEGRLIMSTSFGRSWIQYLFGLPWGAKEIYYRLDWLNNIWGISLRYYKANKDSEDIALMNKMSDIYGRVANGKLLPRKFRRNDCVAETTFYHFDPCMSPSFSDLSKIHHEFINEITRMPKGA